MKEEMLKRLDALGEKLGATGQYLWEVMVRGEYVTAITYVVIGVFAAAISAWLFWQASKVSLRGKDYGEYIVGGFLTGLLAASILAINVPSAICPEHAALKAVLRALK